MEKTIEETIEDIVAKQPDIEKDDMKQTLKSVRDPYRPKKQRWSNSTIRNRIDAFYRKKEQKIQFASPDKSSLKVEGMPLSKHPDIFKAEEQTIARGERLDIPDHIAGGTPAYEPVLGYDATKIQENINSFKEELISIVKKVNTDTDTKISKIECEIANLKREFNIPEPEVEYDMLELKKPLIISIKKICEERNIDDESDYIETLMKREQIWDGVDLNKTNIVIQKYNSLIDIIKKSGGSAVLKIDFDAKSGQLLYEEKPGRFRFRTKMFITAGIIAMLLIGIGTGIGFASYFKLVNIIPPFF